MRESKAAGMTHDELLARIDKIEGDACWYQQRGSDCDGMHSVIRSLRAVMELHKPTEDGKCSVCIGVYYASTAMVQSITYPCPTIQAIMEQLK